MERANLPTRKRVLHLLKVYRPDFSGEAMFFERCSAVMHALDPSVEHDLLVTRTLRTEQPIPPFGMISRVFYLSKLPLSQASYHLRLLLWMARNIRKYDVVHMHTHVDWYFLSYLLPKLTGKRIVLSATLDDSIPGLLGTYSQLRRPLARRLFGLFDGFISVSPKLHHETSAVVQPERCHLIEYGIHFPPSDRSRGLEMRDRLGISHDALVLVFVGGLCDRKDPMLLIRNHVEILKSRPDCWLLLLGPELEPDYVAELHRTVRTQGLEGRVLFLGRVENPHLYFEAADIMTFASKSEGFGMVVPEAMGHALPVVVKRLPGVNDSFVRDGETGFMFDEDQGYVRAVERLSSDPALRKQIGCAGRTLVQAKYDLGRVARSYLAAYGLGAVPDPTGLPVSETLSNIAGPFRSASITDQRFHTPAPAAALGKTPRLIVLADAEESFDWGKPFSRDATEVGSMGAQWRAHRIFERYGVKPTYLVDYPVLAQDAGSRPLLEFLQSGACGIGAQLHSWVTPPFEEEVSAWNSFQGNLPLELEFEKLRRLTQKIGEVFDLAPSIFRAGRYGAGPRTAELLLRLGYRADSSVMPHWMFAPTDGGPDYRGFSARPFWLDQERRLLEIPNSVACLGRLAGWGERLERLVFNSRSQAARVPGIAAKLGLFERIRLSPEGTSVDEAKRLMLAMRDAGHSTFVVSYHTPSLQPGNTPYVRTGDDLTRFLDWLDQVLGFFQSEIRGSFSTWDQIYDLAVERAVDTARGAEMKAERVG